MVRKGKFETATQRAYRKRYEKVTKNANLRVEAERIQLEEIEKPKVKKDKKNEQ